MGDRHLGHRVLAAMPAEFKSCHNARRAMVCLAPRKAIDNPMLRLAKDILLQLGIDPRKGINSIRGLVPFLRDLREYKRQSRNNPDAIPISTLHPIMHERFASNGGLDAHYFYQDLWAARKIYQARPGRQVDVGSAMGGFISHLLVFRDVEVVDVRPTELGISGLTTIVADATQMSGFADNSLESLSSLHAAEHFGLGRYGDPVNPAGHLMFMRSLARVLKPGGRLYFAVPCGLERVFFNAHRVLSPRTIMRGLAGLTLLSFSCVTDDGKFHEDCEFNIVEKQTYGCGMFELTK